MTISSSNNRDDYTGNGTTANYAYTFRVYAKTDIKVYVVKTSDGTENLLTVDTDYRVNNIGESTGTIDLYDIGQEWIDGSSYLASGYTLAIVRDLPFTQPTEFRNQGTFYPATHEDAIDRAVMLSQQLNEESSRAVAFSKATNIGSFDPTLPAELATSGAGKLIVINAAGDGFEAGPTAGNIAAAESNAVAAAASAAAALASETAAAASAADAETAVAAGGAWQDIVYKTFTNNNDFILNTDTGKVFVVDASSGATNLYLPIISTINLSVPYSVIVKRNKADASTNAITITTSGVDKVNDSSTTVITLPSGGEYQVEFIPDSDKAPDQWEAVFSGEGAFNAQATTKGDIISHNTNSPQVLGIGLEGQSLVVDSTASTGFKWDEGIKASLQKMAYINYNTIPISGIGTTYSWTKVCQGSNGYIVVLGDGNINAAMSSADYGVSFNARTLAASITFKDLIYSDTASLFIALGNTGATAVQTSTIGSTWANRTTPNLNWEAVCDSGSLIVAVSSNGTSGGGAMYSTNGTTWTQSTACQDVAFKAIATDGTTFVAVGNSGVVSTSTDGDTWTARTAAWTSTNWETITWDAYNQQFLANGSGAAGEEFMTSPDGITWSAGHTGNMSFTRLKHDGQIYLGILPSSVYSSIDGVNWDRGTSLMGGSLKDITFSEGRAIIVNNTAATNRIWFSDTGPLGIRV